MASKGRVLVVDDERSLRRLLRLYLEREDYTVLEAANGVDGLSLLRQGRVDVALVDVMLPELDGFELVRRIRSDSDVPIILLTARGEETKRVAGLELGADDCVVKPFSMPEVIARVGAQLRRAGGFQPAGPLLHGRLELDELLDHVWGSSYVSAKTVDVHIAALRRKLGDALQVKALRGVGYRLET